MAADILRRARRRSARSHLSTRSDLFSRLPGYVRTLELARSVVTVAVGALRLQNADCDRDIADVLTAHVDNRLDELLDDLATARGISRTGIEIARSAGRAGQ